MAMRYSRAACLARLRAQIESGHAIVMAGAGNGLAAKFIERAGVDLIGIYNTGYFRMQGCGSLAGMLPILDANALVFQTADREVLPRVTATPVIAGVNGVDPLRDMPRFLSDLAAIGISGVHNFPTVAWFDGNFRRSLEATGLGYAHELAMLRAARELDLLTIGYAFNAADTERLMEEASPDVFIFHAGITAGGTTGDTGAMSLAETARRSEEHFTVARRIRPDVILLAHGAAIVDPDDAQYVLDNTSCHGVQFGSSIERLAVEGPIEARAAAFKAGRLPTGRR
ncbi:phosphoenolpyruvate hydrolase family protein [Bradyrhizobium tunisiense]|uniref:phosphoenolpyruvate hydrolase family protein n=1 Tax=Bradyrhizobium tunisiense TaxID=3278709 RepID=UPI0035E16C37